VAMRYRVRWQVADGLDAFGAPLVRYGMLERLARSAEEHGVRVLAFGLGCSEVRLVLEGRASAVANVTRGVKVGTLREVRSRDLPLAFGRTRRHRVADLAGAVAWVHRAPLDDGIPDPLASPWTSHRDLLGWREAAFFDPAPLRAALDPSALHDALGGGALPAPVPPPARHEPLHLLLRVAAAIRGVLPADRRCFGLFCQLARARGWATREVAQALMLTARRVRQLYHADEPLVPVALSALGDPCLCRVP